MAETDRETMRERDELTDLIALITLSAQIILPMAVREAALVTVADLDLDRGTLLPRGTSSKKEIVVKSNRLRNMRRKLSITTNKRGREIRNSMESSKMERKCTMAAMNLTSKMPLPSPLKT